METQYQHLTMTQRNDLLELLQKIKELFGGTLGIWKTYPVEFELRDIAKPICLRPYPIPKVHEEMIKKKVENLV